MHFTNLAFDYPQMTQISPIKIKKICVHL